MSLAGLVGVGSGSDRTTPCRGRRTHDGATIRTLRVSLERPGAYPSIVDALTVAPPGSVVAVDPGTYHESLDLTGVDVTLEVASTTAGTGTDAAVVLAGTGSTEPVVRCRSGALTLRGITVRAEHGAGVHVTDTRLIMDGCHVGARLGAAVLVAARSELALTGCMIEDAHQGLVVEDATGTVERTTFRGILDDGIVVRFGAQPTLRNCTITGCGHRGVYVYQFGRPTIEACEISDTGNEGVAVAQGGAARLIRVRVHDTLGVAISFGSRTSGEVRGCQVENALEPGVLIADDADVTVHEEGAPSAGLDPADRGQGDPEKVAALLAELDAMVGLASVKAEVKSVIDEIQVNEWRRGAGLSVGGMSHHLIFAGAPGTGKTTVGRIYGQLLAALGVLPGGPLREVSRRDLVGQYVGHTAEKTAAVFEESRGGVVFLDEAYTLSREAGSGGADFGQEAIDMIVKLMEDMRNEIAVIAAGYTHEMQRFLDANPGLASRFVKTIEFENYSADELVLIISRIVRAGDYALAPEAAGMLPGHFASLERNESFGNAREARKLFELLRKVQSQRLRRLGRQPTVEELLLLTEQDVATAVAH